MHACAYRFTTGGLHDSALYASTAVYTEWDRVGNGSLPAVLLLTNDTTLNWVDTFAFTDGSWDGGPGASVGEGGVIFTTNKLAQYIDQDLDFAPGADPNFRVCRCFKKHLRINATIPCTTLLRFNRMLYQADQL